MTKTLMFQGTSSSAGKSLLTAAFCRIFAHMGIKVAPFKAQNMSLNSFVTRDGREIGRAQALQAQASGLEPDARMNPVLLKPLGNYQSQVIILGKPAGIMTFREYMARKGAIWKEALAAYNALAREYDVVVLEGAGSPAEINLRSHDMANMRMAHAAKAKVLLIADIDRGGAFAALTGTMALLSPRDRKCVAGYVLNKFRGDKTLLGDALRTVFRRTLRPFLGIVPMLENLRLPEEDSALFRESFSGSGDKTGKPDIALLNLPAISNFTDMDALKRAGLDVRLISNRHEFGAPDLLLLPGTRNCGKALDYLRTQGLAELVKAYAAKITATGRGHLAGICGGLQIMGKSVEDACGVEFYGSRPGLGILDISTSFSPDKILRQAGGVAHVALAPEAPPVHGYEIHHGQSAAGQLAEAVITDMNGAPLGWGIVKDGACRIWGTYLHGIFDSDAFRKSYLSRVAADAGLECANGDAQGVDWEIDRLAAHVRENMEMDSIFRLLEM